MTFRVPAKRTYVAPAVGLIARIGGDRYRIKIDGTAWQALGGSWGGPDDQVLRDLWDEGETRSIRFRLRMRWTRWRCRGRLLYAHHGIHPAARSR